MPGGESVIPSLEERMLQWYVNSWKDSRGMVSIVMVVIHAYVLSTQMHACKLGNVASSGNLFEQLHVENGLV